MIVIIDLQYYHGLPLEISELRPTCVIACMCSYVRKYEENRNNEFLYMF